MVDKVKDLHRAPPDDLSLEDLGYGDGLYPGRLAAVEVTNRFLQVRQGIPIHQRPVYVLLGSVPQRSKRVTPLVLGRLTL